MSGFVERELAVARGFAACRGDEARLDEADAEIEALRSLCAAAYQVVGAADGPTAMLDNLSAAASGKPLPHEPMAGLPWSGSAEVEALRADAERWRKIEPMFQGCSLFIDGTAHWLLPGGSIKARARTVAEAVDAMPSVRANRATPARSNDD